MAVVCLLVFSFVFCRKDLEVVLVCARTPIPKLATLYVLLGPSPCKLPKIFDVGIAIDVSASIGQTHFKQVNKFLEKFVAQFDIGPKRTHIGMLIFSTKAKLLHTLDDPKYHNVAALEEAARKVPYFGGGTFTNRALKMADEKFFDTKTDRKLIPNVLLVLTDGKTNSKSEPYPKMLAPLKVGLLTLSGPEGVGVRGEGGGGGGGGW